MKRLSLISKLLIITLVISTMTSCDKDDNNDTISIVSDNNSVVSENISDINSGVSSKIEDNIKKELKINYSKIGTKIEDKKGLYKLNRKFDKFYSSIYEFGDYILFEKYIYNVDNGAIKKVEWLLYDPVDNNIIIEKTVDINDYCTTFISNNGIGLYKYVDNSIYIYNNNLELLGSVEVGSNAGEFKFSKDLKTMYYMEYDKNYRANTYITVLDISNLSSKTHNKTKIETMLIEPNIINITDNNTLIVKGTNNNNYINVNRLISEDGKIIELDMSANNNLTVSEEDNKYFSYRYDYTNSGIYFGDINGKDYFAPKEFNQCLWDCKNNAVIISNTDYDTEKKIYEYYSLKDGSKLNEFIFTGDLLSGDVSYSEIYLSKYDAVMILKCNNFSEDIEILLWDLKVTDTFEDKLDIKEKNGIDIVIDDWGDLKEEHEKALAIGEKYGVEIYIGNECTNQDAWNYSGKIILDKETIKNTLNSFEEAFANYPDNFINQLKYGDYNKVKIYLTGTLTLKGNSGLSNCGAFVAKQNDYTYVVFDMYQPIVENVYHEFSHIIDDRLWFISTIKDISYSENGWSELNPSNFEYLSYEYYENNDLSNYDEYIFNDDSNRYFVSYYSLTRPTEDRATLLESAMGNYYFWHEYEIKDSGIYKKLEYYSKCIREGFDTTNWEDTTLWEQALNKTY